MVNIIIPAYNAHKTIRQALSSIAMQDNLKNVNVTIIDDCSDKAYDYLIDSYIGLKIMVVRNTIQIGPGLSRQRGIDISEDEYIMFLDADDCLLSPNCVDKLLLEISEDNLDFVYSDFMEETEGGDYIIHEGDLIWLHGKIYRRAFLVEKSIKFSDTLYNEDSSFNTISYYTGKSKYINYSTYVWKYNSNSLTHKNDYFMICMPDYIKNAIYSLNECWRLNVESWKIYEIFIKYLCALYGYYNLFWAKNVTENFMKEYLKNINELINCVPLKLPKRNIILKDMTKTMMESAIIIELIEQDVLFRFTVGEFVNCFAKIERQDSKVN